MTPTQRLEQAGLDLPSVPSAVGSYVPARRHGGVVWVTGQLPFVDGDLPWRGVVGETIDEADARQASRAAALNALSAAAGEVGGLDRLTGVIEVIGFTACTPDFDGLGRVLDAACEVYPQVFGEDGVPVRTNVGVSSLPLRSPVEIKVTFTCHVEGG